MFHTPAHKQFDPSKAPGQVPTAPKRVLNARARIFLTRHRKSYSSRFIKHKGLLKADQLLALGQL